LTGDYRKRTRVRGIDVSLDGDLLSALVGLMAEDRETMVPTRLSVLVYLYFTQQATFPVLQKTLRLTSGNLSCHLKKLEEMGLIRISKRFVDLKPTTWAVLTKDGAGCVKNQMIRMRELVLKVVKERPRPNEYFLKTYALSKPHPPILIGAGGEKIIPNVSVL
jgi:DNA-binding MarR family transcriptional regulator